jgi:hypothetical protein
MTLGSCRLHGAAEKLLSEAPGTSLWFPYLGETLDSGAALCWPWRPSRPCARPGRAARAIPGLNLTGPASPA